MSGERRAKQCMMSQWRPRQRWTDQVKEDLKLLDIREGEQLAKNRELWRSVVEAAMDL
ncbi:putative transposon-derived protein F52C9.6 [Aphis craccivora]|uniref:Putative transposon-derived protein F52C9.6 n=1 Tax=Aphis craccivora TaxID=307492 RepID=A0A6G0ZJS8_APHCR|nr:putative transposon-derived protein F52C9.6 [Aphis craccivora]